MRFKSVNNEFSFSLFLIKTCIYTGLIDLFIYFYTITHSNTITLQVWNEGVQMMIAILLFVCFGLTVSSKHPFLYRRSGFEIFILP